MARQDKVLEKKRGRPPIGKGVQVNMQLRPEQAAALDAYSESAGKSPSRPHAARAILVDWLTGHGFLKRGDNHPEPAGPATDAIERMDTDIAKDKAKRKR